MPTRTFSWRGKSNAHWRVPERRHTSPLRDELRLRRSCSPEPAVASTQRIVGFLVGGRAGVGLSALPMLHSSGTQPGLIRQHRVRLPTIGAGVQ
jgi:hypothetical protein